MDLEEIVRVGDILPSGQLHPRGYEVEEMLGGGSSGVIVKAHPLSDPESSYAIKVMRSEHILAGSVDNNIPFDPSTVAQIESQRMARLVQKGNIHTPGFIEYVDVDDITSIVMQFINGKTLAELTNESDIKVNGLGVLDTASIVNYTKQILDALLSMHEEGILHRDIQPKNIMVDEHGLVKLIDYGFFSGAHPSIFTIPPECIYDEDLSVDLETYDERSEVFSLNSVMYHMATGFAPSCEDINDGNKREDRLKLPARQRRILGDFTPILEIRPDFDPKLADLIETPLRQNQSERWDISEMCSNWTAYEKRKRVVDRRKKTVWAGTVLALLGSVYGVTTNVLDNMKIAEELRIAEEEYRTTADYFYENHPLDPGNFDPDMVLERAGEYLRFELQRTPRVHIGSEGEVIYPAPDDRGMIQEINYRKGIEVAYLTARIEILETAENDVLEGLLADIELKTSKLKNPRHIVQQINAAFTIDFPYNLIMDEEDRLRIIRETLARLDEQFITIPLKDDIGGGYFNSYPKEHSDSNRILTRLSLDASFLMFYYGKEMLSINEDEALGRISQAWDTIYTIMHYDNTYGTEQILRNGYTVNGAGKPPMATDASPNNTGFMISWLSQFRMLMDTMDEPTRAKIGISGCEISDIDSYLSQKVETIMQSDESGVLFDLLKPSLGPSTYNAVISSVGLIDYSHLVQSHGKDARVFLEQAYRLFGTTLGYLDGDQTHYILKPEVVAEKEPPRRDRRTDANWLDLSRRLDSYKHRSLHNLVFH